MLMTTWIIMIIEQQSCHEGYDRTYFFWMKYPQLFHGSVHDIWMVHLYLSVCLIDNILVHTVQHVQSMTIFIYSRLDSFPPVPLIEGIMSVRSVSLSICYHFHHLMAEVILMYYLPSTKLHSSKILTIQQRITRGVSSVGKPCRALQRFPR